MLERFILCISLFRIPKKKLGECQIGKPTGEQEPRGVSVNRCKACWLKICLDRFVLEDETKEVIDSHYMPRLQRLDTALNESRLGDDDDLNSTHNLPPLPILNTRKRKTNDDALVEKYTIANDEPRKQHTEFKGRRKHKDDHSKSDKRERKRKLIYSPPPTPKRSPKKQQRFNQSRDDDQCSESMYKPTDKQSERNLNSSSYLDEFNSSESGSFNKLSNQFASTHCARHSTETSCSLSSGDRLNNESNDCGNCSNCIDAKNLLIVQDIVQDTKPSNQLTMIDEFSSEDCVVDNCSELSYELANKQDDYLKESFYDFAPTKTTEEELGLTKYIKNYEKQGTKKESKFTKSTGKKVKKRKEILTGSNLMRKSLMKKNSFSYIFDADSTVIYEVLNANSPFL